MKQKELSRRLRGILVLLLLCCVFFGGVVLPALGRDLAVQCPELAYLYWPCLIFLWLTAVPVLAALFLAWRIFEDIGRDRSFTAVNARRLGSISRLALLDTVLYPLGGAALLCQNALHPSVLLGLVVVVLLGAGVTAATAALSHLTQKAAALKNDSDLTI